MGSEIYLNTGDVYSVKINNTVIAKEMTLENASILVKALFKKWRKEPSISITIVKEERTNGSVPE